MTHPCLDLARAGRHPWRMIKRLILLFVFVAVAPVAAQGLSPEALAKQSQAIAIRVQQQLMACWDVPPGEEDQRLALDIAFFGDGRLDGAVLLAPETAKLASKRAALTDMVMLLSLSMSIRLMVVLPAPDGEERTTRRPRRRRASVGLVGSAIGALALPRPLPSTRPIRLMLQRNKTA